jgi:hypothetical protein
MTKKRGHQSPSQRMAEVPAFDLSDYVRKVYDLIKGAQRSRIERAQTNMALSGASL